jgi:BolA protein
MSETAARIESILRERFAPVHVALRDDSANHAGHAGATSGGGHYQLVLVSEAFEGIGRLEQHRLVHEALAGMIGSSIHALQMTTRSPAEWAARDGR